MTDPRPPARTLPPPPRLRRHGRSHLHPHPPRAHHRADPMNPPITSTPNPATHHRKRDAMSWHQHRHVIEWGQPAPPTCHLVACEECHR